jgi:hypothetical protein
VTSSAEFGTTLALDGSQLAVTAPRGLGLVGGIDPTATAMTTTGTVYTYERVGDAWFAQHTVKAPDPDFDDDYGISLSVSAGAILIGCPREDSAGSGVGPLMNNDDLPDSGAAFLVDFGPFPWSDQGSALAGTSGSASLVGSGFLFDGTNAGLDLTGALPGAVAALFIGFSNASTPLKGGVLVPTPDLPPLLASVPAAGDLSLDFSFPGAPPGTELWCQWAIADAGAPFGVAFSNAVLGVTP